LNKAAVCFNNNKGKIMKYLIRIFLIAVTLNILFAIIPKSISAQPNDANYQEFYDQLSPYGQWVQDPTYGYIWIPSEGSDFTPYLTNGYWVMTEDGWTWVSNYEWGWAPFHYGRWDYNNSYNGWYWVPDNQWGPSWVTWRRSEGYYGWAPMRPGISINASFDSNSGMSSSHWTFVRNRDIENHNIDRNFIDRRSNIQIINKSTVINKTYFDNNSHATYVSGPGRADVQKITGKTIQSVSISGRSKPGQSIANNQLQTYRPQLQTNRNGNKAAPSKVTTLIDSKPVPGNKHQATVNSPNKVITNNQVNTQQKTNISNNRERQVQTSQSPNINTTKNNNSTNRQPKVNTVSRERPVQTSQSPNINTPKNNNSTNRQPKENNMKPPKQNGSMRSPVQNRTIKQPTTNNMQPARSRNMEQPAHSNSTEEKREDRK
jgi:hypothetical protein